MTIQTVKRSSRPIAMRVKKDPLWAHKGSAESRNRKIEDTQLEQFGEALYAKMKNFHTMEREKVGELIQSVLGDHIGISSGNIGKWISAARGYFIKEYGETIIYLAGTTQGYKMAQGAERPARVSKLGHMVIRFKARFLAEASILNEADRKIAGASIIKKIEQEMGGGNIKQLDELIEVSKDSLKVLRLEAKNA